jgi:integrase
LDTFERVVSHLPKDLKDFARFAYYSGWRRSEIAGLQWSHIERDVLRLPPELSKTKDGRVLILDGELHAIIEHRRAVQELDLVFYRTIKNRPGPQPVKTFYKAWKRACKMAKVERYFHDFRRTAVRNMDRAGVPSRVAKEISGHKTDMIFDRYRIVNEQDIREGVQRTQKHLRGQSSGIPEKGDGK